MSGADDKRYLFVPSATDTEHRRHYAGLSERLTDETIAHASRWCEETPITMANDAQGPVAKLIHRFGEHTVARALAQGDPELLPIAARAGLLLASEIADNPRAKLDGTRDQVLALVMEVAPHLGTTFEAIAPTEPAQIVRDLTQQTAPSVTLNRTVVLVERWGTPLLAPVWDETRAENRPEPFAAFEWWETKFPWDQVGPVTQQEPSPDELTGDARARRLATEFARTGALDVGLESVREARRNGDHRPAWMALWIADHRLGLAGVQAFNAALDAAGLPAEPNWVPGSNQLGSTIVTDPWAGPFFDRLLVR